MTDRFSKKYYLSKDIMAKTGNTIRMSIFDIF